jgi:hypothetical protein
MKELIVEVFGEMFGEDSFGRQVILPLIVLMLVLALVLGLVESVENTKTVDNWEVFRDSTATCYKHRHSDAIVCIARH